MINKVAKKLNSIFLLAALIATVLSFGVALSAHAQWDPYTGADYYSSYDNSYSNDYYSNFDSGYGSYDNSCYDCGGGYNYSSSYNNNTCNDCGYTPPTSYCTNCNNNNTYVPPLIVSCTPNTYNTQANQSVTWHANASGGNGNYNYSWSGTDGLSGSGSSQSKTYSSSGSKNAHVTVTSGGKTASADCGTVFVEEVQQSLSGSCTVSDSSINKGDSVQWSANASGGNGSYTYDWSGDYPLSGQSGSNVSTTYDSTGSKNGTVTIRSGNQSITRSCGTVVVGSSNEDLNVSCTVDDRNVEVGDEVRVTAHGTGGNGSYSYIWYGSSPLDGRTGSSQYITYNSTGEKDIRVTVRSDGQERTRSCGTVVVGNNNNNNNDNLNLSCTVNTASAVVGQLVTWNTSVSGGNGNYNYSWSGTDGLYGNSSSISKSYSTVGTKNASVTVTSDGRSRSLNCPVVAVGAGIAQYPGGNLASLSSVYLNQVPYTGVGDSPKFIAFMVGLILWSGAMAYAIIFRKSKLERKNKILAFKKENMERNGIIG